MCHDLDAFAGVAAGRRAAARSCRARWAGGCWRACGRAARVVCGSDATRDALVAPRADATRSRVVGRALRRASGVFAARPDRPGRSEARPVLWSARPARRSRSCTSGSTIPRKRIDVLLDVFAALRAPSSRRAAPARRRSAHDAQQRGRPRGWAWPRHIVTLPFLDRRVLAAVYRRAALVLQPSEREGFGLPVAEAMACGTPGRGQPHPGAARGRRRRRPPTAASATSTRGRRAVHGAARRACRRPGAWARAGRRSRPGARASLHAGCARARDDERSYRETCCRTCLRAGRPASGGAAVMSRLTVLHLGKYYPPDRGGIETVLEALCRGDAAGIEPRALVLEHGADDRARDRGRRAGDARRAASPPSGAVSLTPTLPLWLRARRRPTSSCCTSPTRWRCWRMRWRGRGAADRLVPQRGDPAALAVPAVLRAAARTGCCGGRAHRRGVAADARRAGAGAHRDKCVVIPYGLDSRRLPARRAAPCRRPRAAEPTVLFVGRLVAYKGVDVLLRALAGVPASPSSSATVRCAGSLEALAARARRRAIGSRFLGHVPDDDAARVVSRVRPAVLPSVTRQEAFGMVQLEAMLCGRPVVSTELPTGVPWVNQHGETGSGRAARRPRRRCAPRWRRCAAIAGAARRAGRAGPRARAGAVHRRADVRRRSTSCAEAAVGRPRRGSAPTAPGPAVCAKRALDVALSGAGLLASAPLWALIAAAIKLEDGGPVFYGQERSGLNGVPFRCRKFRSMIPDAEAATGAVQADRARPARDPHRTPAAGDRDGRTAAALEHLPRRHELHRPARAAAGRDRGRSAAARWSCSRTCPGSRARASVRAGADRHRADLRAARHPAPPQVPLRPPLRAPPVVLARRATDRALVLDHVPRHRGSRAGRSSDSSSLSPAGVTTALDPHPAVL